MQTSAELKGYMEGAGSDVADTVAARMTDLANAVFPMSPMERQPSHLALLGFRGVSLRGAEVCAQGFHFHACACLGAWRMSFVVLVS